jgi:hypothetical protein
MTTVTELITQALKDATVVGEGDSASSETMTDAFALFQQLMGQWQSSGKNVYAQVTSSFNATGALSYSIGTGGDVNITRPEKIDNVYWRLNTVDTPLTMLNTYEEYLDLTTKTMSGDATYAFYLPSYPLGTLYIYPQPTSGSFFITRTESLPTFTSITDTIVLPAKYILPIRFSLAELFSVTFQTVISPAVSTMANRYRVSLRKSNTRVPTLQMPAFTLGRFNINTGL